MVVALSTDSLNQSEGVIEDLNLSITLLCDEEKKVVDLFNLRNPFEHDGIAYPAIFVITPQGRICYRSLDRTASRVRLTEVLTFLDELKADQAAEEQGGARKAFIFPSPSVMWQITQNILFRGTGADWKHYFRFTFVYTPQNLYKRITKPFRKT